MVQCNFSHVGRCCFSFHSECVDRNSFYPHGASWSPDVCTNCTCYNGTSACGIQYCESTLCPAEQVVTRYGECCPACAKGRCSFTNNNNNDGDGDDCIVLVLLLKVLWLDAL